MNPMELHAVMLKAGVKEAVLTTADGEKYEYLQLSADEFQFGRNGDVLTNYTTA